MTKIKTHALNGGGHFVIDVENKTIILKNGKVFPVELTLKEDANEGNRPKYYLVFDDGIKDITDPWFTLCYLAIKKEIANQLMVAGYKVTDPYQFGQ